jgi:polyisoprenoid-binding protein YceI
MKIRVLIALCAALVLAVSTSVFAPARAASEGYTIDAVHSTVLFRVKHLDVSYAYGRFNDFSGTITMDGGNATGVEFVVKATSVDTDFFNVAQYPTITFKSTSVKKVDDTHFEVVGDLTFHGATKPITVQMEKTGTGKGRDGSALVGFEGTFTIQRSQFGMTYGTPGLGEDVRITISVEAAKK